MLKIDAENGLIRIFAEDALASSDYDRFVPQFERIADRKHGAVPMMIELASDFSGWDLGGIWRELKFDMKHKDSFGRIAIVGDSKWDEGGTKLFDPVFRAETRFFTPLGCNVAESWAREGGIAS